MYSKKTKLELTWIGKEHRPRLEPRILLEEPDKEIIQLGAVTVFDTPKPERLIQRVIHIATARRLLRLPWQQGRLPEPHREKIPKAVLTRCEWGKDDYSLKVENLPKTPPAPGQQELF